MEPTVLVPLAIALPVAVVATAAHRKIRPELSANLLMGAIVGSAIATVPTAAVIAVSYLAHLPVMGRGFEFCRAVLGFHVDVDPLVGVAAVALLAIGSLRVVNVVRRWRRHRCCHDGPPRVVDSARLWAYSLPGPGGRVVMSTGLLESLDDAEMAVVLAHERGHTAHRHDRHLLVADLVAALVPPAALLRRRLRFVLERWADESAVAAVGGDRRLVAMTLARVALSHEHGDTVVAFNRLGVAARVEALLEPHRVVHQGWWSATMATGVSVVAVAAAVQVHHLSGVLAALCHG